MQNNKIREKLKEKGKIVNAMTLWLIARINRRAPINSKLNE